MLNKELLESQLAELPLYVYEFIDPAELEFSERVRWICEHECPMYGKAGHVLPEWAVLRSAGESAAAMSTA